MESARSEFLFWFNLLSLKSDLVDPVSFIYVFELQNGELLFHQFVLSSPPILWDILAMPYIKYS